MSHYQISSRQYYIFSLAIVTVIIVLAIVFAALNRGTKADVIVPTPHLPEVEPATSN